MTGFDYETIFKSLQNIRKNSPLIAVACGLSKLSILENLSTSSKINPLFVSHETIFSDYNISSSTILIDLSYFVGKPLSEIKASLKSFASFDRKILSIGQEISYFKNPLKILQSCLNIKPDIIIYDYYSKDYNIESYTERLKKGFFNRKNYNPIICKTGYLGDEIIDKSPLQIAGQENAIHHIICTSFIYGYYSTAFLGELEPKLATFSAMMVIRAASRRALSVTAGPASFFTVFLDSLHHFKRDYLYPIRIQQESQTSIQPSTTIPEMHS